MITNQKNTFDGTPAWTFPNYQDLLMMDANAPLGRPQKKKSKKREIVPLSVDPYPPTIKREVLIRDNFDFFLPPTLLTEIETFLKKLGSQAHL